MRTLQMGQQLAPEGHRLISQAIADSHTLPATAHNKDCVREEFRYNSAISNHGAISNLKGALCMNSVRFHPLAIIVATLCYFGLGAIWFTLFRTAWLEGVGRTMEQLQASGVTPALAYIVALLLTLAIALFLSWIIQATGPATASRGVQIAIILWFCVVFATFGTEYAFEARGVKILAINTGYCLIGMVLMGAVLGGWKQKTV